MVSVSSTMTSAELRDIAHERALDLKWEEAADYMQLAIERYPGNPDSVMTRNDISRMTSRMRLYRLNSQGEDY